MEEIAAVNRIPKERLRGMSGYLVAVGATGLALLVRVALAPWVFERATFMPFFMAIIGTAWYGGLRPGLLATALSAGAGAFFLLPPHHSLWVESGSDRLQLALFVCTGVGICLACESLHVARRRAKQRREVLRAILSSMGDAVISTDPEGRVTSVNPVAAALTGWTPDEAAGRPLDDVVRIVNGQTRLAVENPVKCVLAAGGSVGLASHSLLIAKDGTERFIEGNASPIRGAEGRIGDVVLIFRDATERRQAEERASRLLAREQARLERLGHVAKASLTINSANTRDSVVGVLTAEAKRIFDVTHAEVLLDAEPPAGGDGALIVPLLGRCGRPLGCVHLNGRAGGGFDGEDTAILTQLAHMAAVAFENARLYEELRDADRRKDEFLALLAHELRNPLAPIRNALQVMRLAGGDPATAERSREMIERQVQQMVRLVDDLMDVSRISRGKLQLRTERVSLASVVNAAVETCRPLLSAKRQDLCVTLPEEVPVEADPTRLAQVVLNLLNNAAKYTDEGGSIRLTLEQRGAEAVVIVKNTGIGISPQMLPRIFEMFTQVDHTLERSQGGLGIGLTLVKRLVELHGGTVEARSDGLGRGCEFVVRVPLAAAEPQAAPPDESSGGEASTTRAEQRILVVDDNRDAVDSLGMLLKVMGHTVRTAYDGLEAVDAAATFKPEIVLLDIGLPRLNGYEAARRIRELAVEKGVLLVALTGWGQEEDRRRSKDAGFDHHLVKPVDPAELQRLLAGLARA
jgi:PAS domain S-box-containing protein